MLTHVEVIYKKSGGNEKKTKGRKTIFSKKWALCWSYDNPKLDNQKKKLKKMHTMEPRGR